MAIKIFLLAAQYFIAIKENQGDVLNTLDTYVALMPPQDKFYADPFLFLHQGVNYIFFEDYDYDKGIISYAYIEPGLKISELKTALKLPTHLSFPSVFEDGAEVYMTPETYDYKSVILFRAVHFPDEWVAQRVLIEGDHFADPILFKHNGYYWLFVAANRDRLRIYYAKTLDSEFLAHPINRRQVRGRNAGYVYWSNGRLIRPVMDCRFGYGRSMILKEIVLLDPEHFEERELALINPTWAPGLTGTHTYNQNEEYVIYDGRR